MNLDDQIAAALIILAVTVIGGFASLIKVWFDQLARKLQENTHMTEQARDAASGAQIASNGQLSAAREEAAQLRERLQVAEIKRDVLLDIVRYIQSRPEAIPLLADYRERRRVRVHDDGVEALLLDVSPRHPNAPPIEPGG